MAKLGIVEEQAGETCLWLEISEEAGLVDGDKVAPLQEANEQNNERSERAILVEDGPAGL